MKIEFPYASVEPLCIPENYKPQVFALPTYTPTADAAKLVINALENPIGSKRLSELGVGKKKVLIVADDISRPTPVYKFIKHVLAELKLAGVQKCDIEFLMALGTHRAMTRDEMITKLGSEVVNEYKVHNHDWQNPDNLEYIGDTLQGVPVWINKLVSKSDLVIGVGSIMPIDICGFTGGGKILVPGVSGPITIDLMHWTRVDSAVHTEILGQADNSTRASIDALARKAGLSFIVNVVLNADGDIVTCVAGDMVAAHRVGCKTAREVFGVSIPREFDIVIADSFPFDCDFWQANKALHTAGQVVRKDGVVILVSPCEEGFSQIHTEILDFGYSPIEKVKRMVHAGEITHKVVGVHMVQVGAVAIEKAKLILVSSGINRQHAEKVGFLWAQTAQKAFEIAIGMLPHNPSIAVLKGAPRMLPLVQQRGK